MGETVSPTTRELLERIRAGRDTLFDFAQQDQTILHGDAHCANALYAADGAVLLDWGNAAIGPGEIDLAHAVALNLPPDLRARWEPSLIDTYRTRLDGHDAPREHDEMMRRYRLGVLYAVAVPLGHWAGGVPDQIWRRLLDNAVSAAEHHDAAALLAHP